MTRIMFLAVVGSLTAAFADTANGADRWPDDIVTGTVRFPGAHVTIDRKGNMKGGPAIEGGCGPLRVGVQVNVPIGNISDYAGAFQRLHIIRHPSGRSPVNTQHRSAIPNYRSAYPQRRSGTPYLRPTYSQYRSGTPYHLQANRYNAYRYPY